MFKKILVFVASFLTTCFITTIVGLVPTFFLKGFFDFEFLKSLEISTTIFGQTYENLQVFKGVTVRDLLTFGAASVAVFYMQKYIAPRAASIILAWLLPLVVTLEALLVTSPHDGLIPKAIFAWVDSDPLYRSAILWTFTLWVESIIIEAVYDGFSEGNFANDLLLNAFTSGGVSYFFYILLDIMKIPAFSRVAYTLLPLVALLQFSLAKRKTVSAKPAAKAATKK